MCGVHWRAAASFISLESLLKDLAFGGPKCYRAIRGLDCFPEPYLPSRLCAYHPVTLGMSQQDNGSQRCSEGE